jgi:hypothetical protein
LPEQADRVEMTDETLVQETGTTHQTLAYNDSHISVVTQPESEWDDSINDIYTPTVELRDFLSRPVKIQSFTWTEGTTLAATAISPWELYFNNPAIVRKLQDFAFLRANLRIKIVINASPFYYGYAFATYKPYPNGPYNAGFIPSAFGTTGGCLAATQRPRIDILPGRNVAGEMVLPFINKQNFINIKRLADFTEMGTLNIFSTDILRNANGVAGTGVDFQIFAWAEDVLLNIPTSDLAAQADEYETNGPISSVASNIAAAAASVTGLLPPVYQPLAMATTIGAGAVSKIASLFGYSNTPVVDDVKPFKNLPFHAMASAEISTPFEKLTVDPKNELTIDPRVAGGKYDELSIESLVRRSSVVHMLNWDSVSPSGTLLVNFAVTPNIHMDEDGTPYDFNTSPSQRFYQTPMSLVSRHFAYWRGTMCYRFKFICTQFHRGRMRIDWDPYADNLFGTSTETNFSRIVDLSNDSEIVIKVPYMQPASFCKNAWVAGESYMPTINNPAPTFPAVEACNGFLSFTILNRLTAPVASSVVPIFCEVWMEDACFAGPRDLQSLGIYVSYLPPQSERVIATEEKHDIPENYISQMIPRTPDSLYKVYMGEAIASMRTLMRRRVYYRTISFPSDSTSLNSVFAMRLGRRPQYFGFDSNGNYTAQQLVGILTSPFNFVNELVSNTFAPCFVGERGSYNFELNLNTTNTSVDTLSMYRRVQGWNSNTFDDTVSSAAATPGQRTRIHMLGTHFISKAGGAVTNQRTQTGLQVQVPMYSRFRMLGTDPTLRNNGSNIDESNEDGVGVTFKVQPIKDSNQNPDRLYVDFYCGIGTDYQLIHFINVPVAYVYPNLPAAI